MALHDPNLRKLYDLKVCTSLFPRNKSTDYRAHASQIFVQCDSDLMLARRLRRDINERGRSVEGVLEQ